jgi:hypothetical protein
MKLNRFRRLPSGYDPPELPEQLCGPDVLADVMLHGREFNRTAMHGGDHRWLAPLTDDGVRKLISLLYYASLMPEEGRFPPFKVTCHDLDHTAYLVGRFDPIPLDKPDALRRLAPACTRQESALLVAERDGAIFCEGVLDVDSMGFGTILGMPGVVGTGLSPTFQVEVFGPGHVRAGEWGCPSYEIRAGRVRPLSSYYVRPATQWLTDAIQTKVTRLALPSMGEQFAERIRDARPFMLVLSKMLRLAADARHGGAFVFLPEAPTDATPLGLKLHYTTSSLDLGCDLARQWESYADVSRKRGTEEFEQAVRNAEFRRNKTLADCEMVGNFSAVDGCVVLTHDLNLVSFGAKIQVSPEESRASPRRFKHIHSGTVYEDEDFMRAIGGTRHQSVARLCQVHERVVVYTVSQDGELKLFYSDAENAYAFGPLDLPTIDRQLDLM